jgi:hypothetical protein
MGRSRLWWLARLPRLARVALVALTVATAGVAAAQPTGTPPKDPPPDADEIEMTPEPATSATGKDPKLAKKWLAAGQLLMQKGMYFAARKRPDVSRPQFENAVTAFQKAIEAGDDVNVYLELAAAEDKIGRFDDAVKHVRRVVSGQGARPDVAKRASAKLTELLAKVGIVTLIVSPAGASVTLGGTELGSAPLPASLVLLPGTYALSFQAHGFQPKEVELVVEAGSESERTIELDAVKVIVEPVKRARPAVPAVVRDDRPAPRSRLPLYVGAGVTGAAVVGATVFGVLALREHATFTSASTTPADREDARSNGKRLAQLTDISIATAVVAAGFTTYWYFYKHKRRDQQVVVKPSAKVDVVPWVQSQSGGVTLAGWF